MANPQMLCVFIPTAGQDAAARVRDLLSTQTCQEALRGSLDRIACLHFASLALLPPLSGQADAKPTLMLELAVDAGTGCDVLADALVRHAGSVLEEIVTCAHDGQSASPARLRAILMQMDPAAGGFVGTRDRTRARITDEHARFCDAKGLFNARIIRPAQDDRAAVVDELIRRLLPMHPARHWAPAPRSLWRKSWMHPVLRALAIAATFVSGPIVALGFGTASLYALIPALLVSALILVAAALVILIVIPVLLSAAIWGLLIAGGMVASIITVPPYSGALASLAAWAGWSLALLAVFTLLAAGAGRVVFLALKSGALAGALQVGFIAAWVPALAWARASVRSRRWAVFLFAVAVLGALALEAFARFAPIDTSRLAVSAWPLWQVALLAIRASLSALAVIALIAAATALVCWWMRHAPRFTAPLVAAALAGVAWFAFSPLTTGGYLLCVAFMLGALLATRAISPSYGAIGAIAMASLLSIWAACSVSLSLMFAAASRMGWIPDRMSMWWSFGPSALERWLTQNMSSFDPGLLPAFTLLMCGPFAALAVLTLGAMVIRVPYRQLQKANAPVNQKIRHSRQIHASILACEAALVHRMQHMISVTDVRKPVWLFAPLLRYTLWGIDTIGRIWCTEGKLGEAPGIHFGHWHVVDQGRRLIFASNFEVPFGGYLDDFIRGTPNGVNLVWRCTSLLTRTPACPGEPGVEAARAFPPTTFGILGGCRNEQWFKSYARDSMVPHLFRFEAYQLTYKDIDRATRFHEAMCRVLTPTQRDAMAEDQIVRALES